MSRGPDAGVRLERALVCNAEMAGIDLRILSADWTRWASATFTGARHRLTLAAVPSSMLDIWLAALSEAEFKLHGQLVADLVVHARNKGVTFVTFEIEALTVEDR